MENIVLVSHGSMADGVKSSLEMIIGIQEHIFTVSLRDDIEQFELDLNKIMNKLKGNVLIITDILGGTPSNVSINKYLLKENINIISGMSLPLVLEATLNSNLTKEELILTAKKSISDVLEIITSVRNDNDE